MFKSLLFIFLFSGITFANEKYLVITNSNNPQDSITKSFVKNIFKGRVVLWSHEVKIDPCYIDPKKNKSGEDILNNVVKITSKKFKRLWLKKVFSSESIAPVSLATIDQVIDFVSKNDGGIAIIPAEFVKRIKKCKIIKMV